MGGGHTNQKSNYNSSITFSPKISGHGSIKNGNISTGSTSGSLNGSSTGGSGGLSLGLMNLPFSCNLQVSCNVGPVKASGGFTYSRLI